MYTLINDNIFLYWLLLSQALTGTTKHYLIVYAIAYSLLFATNSVNLKYH